MEKYDLPLYQRSSFSLGTNLLYLFCTLGMGGMSYLFLALMIKDEPGISLIFGIFMLSLAVLFGYLYIVGGILKRFYLELTSEYMKFSIPFKSRKIFWKEINSVNIFKIKHNIMLGILLEKDLSKKTKRSVANNFNSIYGYPSLSLQIAMRFFKDLEPEKLLNTIGEQVEKADRTGMVYPENLEEGINEEKNSLVKAVGTSLLCSILISILYGFTIDKLEKNYVIIPVFGALIIIAIFNKYYVEKSFSLVIRLVAGLICMIQVPAAVIVAIMIESGEAISVSTISDSVNAYIYYLMHNPWKQISVIIVALVCFGMGVIRGRVGFNQRDN